MIPYLTSDCQPQLKRCLSFHLVSPAPAVASTLLFHAIPQPALSQRISSGRAPTSPCRTIIPPCHLSALFHYPYRSDICRYTLSPASDGQRCQPGPSQLHPRQHLHPRLYSLSGSLALLGGREIPSN